MKSGGKGLCPGCFGLAIGIVWGLWVFLAALLCRGNVAMVSSMGSIYLGYGPTFMGSLIGGLWGLLHGFVAGFLIAWIYNTMCRCCKCRFCKGKCCACNCGKCNYKDGGECSCSCGNCCCKDGSCGSKDKK